MKLKLGNVAITALWYIALICSGALFLAGAVDGKMASFFFVFVILVVTIIMTASQRENVNAKKVLISGFLIPLFFAVVIGGLVFLFIHLLDRPTRGPSTTTTTTTIETNPLFARWYFINRYGSCSSLDISLTSISIPFCGSAILKINKNTKDSLELLCQNFQSEKGNNKYFQIKMEDKNPVGDDLIASLFKVNMVDKKQVWNGYLFKSEFDCVKYIMEPIKSVPFTPWE